MIGSKVKSATPIRTVEELREHLVDACRIEMSTIPLYLYALYSVRARIPNTRGSNAPVYTPLGAYEALRAIAIEEMLHMLLVRNLLLSIGGDVRFYDADFAPTYPCSMLHHQPRLRLNLAPLSSAQLDDFLAIELPEKSPSDRTLDTTSYRTLAELYDAVEAGFIYLGKHDKTLFKNPRERHQISNKFSPYWNQSGGGKPIAVTDLASAKEAITTIVRQGEGNRHGIVGIDPTRPSDPDNPAVYSHHVRLSMIKTGYEPVTPLKHKKPNAKRSPKEAALPDLDHNLDAIWPLAKNPDPRHFPVHVRALADLFDACYSYTLKIIDEAYAVEYPEAKVTSDRKWHLIQNLLTSMGAILFPIADLLVRQPIGHDEHGHPVHAGPPFRFRRIPGRTAVTRRDSLLAGCDALSAIYPSLVGENSPRWFISLLTPV